MLEWEGGRLGSDMVGLLLGSLAAGLQEQPDDARDWMDETDIEEVDDSYPEHAEEAIDRLAMSLGESLEAARANLRWRSDTAIFGATRSGNVTARRLEMSLCGSSRHRGGSGRMHRRDSRCSWVSR